MASIIYDNFKSIWLIFINISNPDVNSHQDKITIYNISTAR